MVIHTVFFWLKSGSPAGARKQLAEDCIKYLGGVPTVRHLFAGPPAKTVKRDIIDASYDVGLTAVFNDIAGHDVYQEHPLHKEFIARNKEHWDRVQIYDYESAD